MCIYIFFLYRVLPIKSYSKNVQKVLVFSCFLLLGFPKNGIRFQLQETGNGAGSVHSSPASCHADASEISHHSDEAHDKTDIAPQESIFETFGKHRPCGRIRDAPRFPMTFGSPILLRGGPEMQHRHHATSLPYLRPVAHWRLAVGELHNLKQEHLETLRNSSDDDNASEIKTFPSSETVSEIATLKCRKKQLQGVPNFF